MSSKGKLFLGRSWTMRNAILGLCLCTVVIALLFQTVLLQSVLRRQIRDEAIADNEAALQRLLLDVSSFIRETNTQMLGVYSESDLVADLREDAQGKGSDALKKYFWRSWYLARKRFPVRYRLNALYIYNTRDEMVSAYRYNSQNFPRDLYAAEYEVNKDKLWEYVHSDETALFLSGYHNPREGKDILRLVLKLHSYGQDRSSLGYLVTDLDARVFTDIMNKYRTTEGVLLWLQPLGDNPICHSGAMGGDMAAGYGEVSGLVMEGIVPDEEIREVEGAYLVKASHKEYNLCAFALVPQSLMTAAQKSQTATLLISTLVMILISTLLAALLSRWISQPMEEMTQTIERIRGGETGLRMKPTGWGRELVLLGEEFNAMLDRISQMVAEEYEYKLLVERTEYKMLQAQINPHFLYNTLNTMSAIATSQNCPMVSGLCQSLSAIFRYCLDMSDELSTVQKEVAHTRNYLYVMDVRNGGTVKVEYEIAQEALSCPLPRITLQPIVENAMNHGLRNVRRRDKLLQIKGHLQDGNLILEVEDNGSGMDADAMNEELSKADPRRVESGVSIGILNVNARIKKIFGMNYGLFVSSEPGKGTRVVITVPATSPGRDVHGEEISPAGGGR